MTSASEVTGANLKWCEEEILVLIHLYLVTQEQTFAKILYLYIAAAATRQPSNSYFQREKQAIEALHTFSSRNTFAV